MSFHGVWIPTSNYDDWMEKRKRGLGASDVAAIFRLSKWTSPYALWAEKTGQIATGEPSDAMVVGRVVGPAILNLWEGRTGLKAVMRDSMWQHPEIPWALASPDALIAESSNASDGIGHEALGVLEVKHEFVEWDEIPAQYRIQVCWQQGVTGLHSTGQIVNLSARKKLQIFDVEWDPELWLELLAGAEHFWQLVTSETPPPIDDSDSTSYALSALFPAGDAGGEVELEGDLVKTVDRLRKSKERLAIAKREVKQYENEIKAAMGDADVGLIDGQEVVTWKTQHRGAYAVGETSFRVLRLKGVKE